MVATSFVNPGNGFSSNPAVPRSGTAPPPLLPLPAAASRRPVPESSYDNDVVVSEDGRPPAPNNNQERIPLRQLPEANNDGWRSYKVSRVRLNEHGITKSFVGVAHEANKPGSPVLILVRDLFTHCFRGWMELELQRALQALNATLYKLNS